MPLHNLRPEYLKRIKDDFPSERLIFGSDFPMVPFPLLGGHLKDVDVAKITEVALERSPLDRNIEAFKALGFKDCIFSNAEKILRMTPRSLRG